MATKNIFHTSKTNNERMIFLWTRYDYNYDYDLEPANKKDITKITLEPDTTNKQFFSGRDIEKIISKLEKDNEALSCYVSRSLDKIIISKIKPVQEEDE
jgi:hypothetical protein